MVLLPLLRKNGSLLLNGEGKSGARARTTLFRTLATDDDELGVEGRSSSSLHGHFARDSSAGDKSSKSGESRYPTQTFTVQITPLIGEEREELKDAENHIAYRSFGSRDHSYIKSFGQSFVRKEMGGGKR